MRQTLSICIINLCLNMSYNCLWNELFSESFFFKICFASLPSIVAVQKKSWRRTSGLLALQINGFCPSYLVALSSKRFDIHFVFHKVAAWGIFFVSCMYLGSSTGLRTTRLVSMCMQMISSCICPSIHCRHLRNMMRSEHLSKPVQLKFELGWSPTYSR